MFRKKKNRNNSVLPVSAALLIFALAPNEIAFSIDKSAQSTSGAKSDTAVAQTILAERYCPCGCGNFLPGSANSPACFGCSVGKAEITRVLEGLAEGRTPKDIIAELNEKVLIDVFADYTVDGLPEAWDLAKRVSAEYDQYRVVLRPLGGTENARRAIRLSECARSQGMFTIMHEALIEHSGPWDTATLIALATKHGLAGDKIAECFLRVDISAQMAKDRQHAKLLNANDFPAVSVNRKLCPPNEESLRKAIRKVLIEGTI